MGKQSEYNNCVSNLSKKDRETTITLLLPSLVFFRDGEKNSQNTIVAFSTAQRERERERDGDRDRETQRD